MGRHEKSGSGGTLPENEALDQMASEQTTRGQQGTDRQAQAAGEQFDAQHSDSAQSSARKDPESAKHTPKP